MNAVHPDLKLSIVDCLRNSLPFRVFGEETISNHWYTEYLKSASSRLNTHRRLVADLLPTRVAGAPAPGPTASPGLGPIPSPSKSIDAGSIPPALPPKTPFFPPSFNAPSPKALLIKKNSSASQGPGSNAQASRENSNRRAVVIAVVVTASVTFFLAALLFLCYNKVCKSGASAGQNDERPLLSLGMIDYSIGII